jgi:integrase
VPGSSYHPLETKSDEGKSELERFRDAAHDSPPLDEVVALVGIDTGLRAAAISHLHESWLSDNDGTLVIDVPMKQKCKLGNGEEGRGGDTTETGAPCFDCKRRPNTDDWLPAQSKLPDRGDCFTPKSEDGYKGREIPIHEPDTERAVRDHFRIFDQIAARTAVRNAVLRVADRAGLHETWTEVKDNGEEVTHHWPTPHDLRNTFGTRLAIKGFNAHEIKSVMGHTDIEQAVDYIELSGAATRGAFDDKW